MDVVGLVLGILSTVLSFYAFGIVGIILSIKSRSKAKKDGKSTHIAIVLNSIGIAFAIVPLLLSLLLVFAYMQSPVR